VRLPARAEGAADDRAEEKVFDAHVERVCWGERAWFREWTCRRDGSQSGNGASSLHRRPPTIRNFVPASEEARAGCANALGQIG
jgi:hypothetical protein